MFQGLWPEYFNDRSFTLQDEDGIIHDVVLFVTEIDLNALKQEMTQQQTDATHVMVHKMCNSTQLHTVYIKALGVYSEGIPPKQSEVAKVINSVPGAETFIPLDMPDNQFFRVKCVSN